MNKESPLKKVCFQSILGSDAFIAQHRDSAQIQISDETAREQRRVGAMPLAYYTSKFERREVAMAEAYRSTAFSMSEIAAHFHVSVKIVSRAIAAIEKAESAQTEPKS